MRNSVSISPMETTSEVRPQDHLKTTVVLPSNPTPRWKRKFFNYLNQIVNFIMLPIDILPPAKPGGILGSTTAADQSQSDAVSTTGRCPFSIHIDRRVVVTVMHRTTGMTRPQAIAERDGVIDDTTHRTELRRREPWIDVMDHGPRFRGDMMQDVEVSARQLYGFGQFNL